MAKQKQTNPSQHGSGDKTPSKGGKAPVDSGKMAPRIVNRRATFDYHVLDKFEAGLELVGSEVKSVRKGHVQLAGAFARIASGEVRLFGAHIEEYEQSNQFNHDPTRIRRLLLHKREIRRLEQRLKKEAGATLIPLEIYFRRGFAKVLLALAKGKTKFDKRDAIKAREDQRNIQQAMRRR